MGRVIRSAVLTNFSEIARGLGIDHLRLMREFGLPLAALSEPELPIDVDAVAQLLTAAAREAGVEDFALRMAEERGLSNLGPMSLAIAQAPTIRSMIDTLRRYMHLHNEALFLRVEEGDGRYTLTVDFETDGAVDLRQATELAIAVVYRAFRGMLGVGWRAEAVVFVHPAPRRPGRHHRLFGPNVLFDAHFNGIVCRQRDVDAALPSGDPALARYAVQFIEALNARRGASVVDKVRQLILVLLPSGRCSADRVAGQLGIDRRTLHRRLARAGASFLALHDDIRGQIARRHLTAGDRRLSEIADMLGFSDQTAFARWFKTRFGCTVTAWRRSDAINARANDRSR